MFRFASIRLDFKVAIEKSISSFSPNIHWKFNVCLYRATQNQQQEFAVQIFKFNSNLKSLDKTSQPNHINMNKIKNGSYSVRFVSLFPFVSQVEFPGAMHISLYVICEIDWPVEDVSRIILERLYCWSIFCSSRAQEIGRLTWPFFSLWIMTAIQLQ